MSLHSCSRDVVVDKRALETEERKRATMTFSMKSVIGKESERERDTLNA